MARRELLSAMLTSRKATFGVVVVALIVLVAVLSPQLAPYDPGAQSLGGRLLPPLSTGTDGLLHLLGTDQLGRDILSRLIYGARISLMVGVSASLLAGTLGGCWFAATGGPSTTSAAVRRAAALPHIPSPWRSSRSPAQASSTSSWSSP
jgi:peptide/nickel transport system permease protein